MLGVAAATMFAVAWAWWPLAGEYLASVAWGGAWWRQVDWLLVGILAFLLATTAAGADWRIDGVIILVGLGGGLAIEWWGTNTNLWFYFSGERPPLWILPAWALASLSIHRLSRVLDAFTPAIKRTWWRLIYWTGAAAFLGVMLPFVRPAIGNPATVVALAVSVAVLATPTDQRRAVLAFVAGAGLGWFLERWGTTRECWIYHTWQTPPLFAVLAHGLAAVAFCRAEMLLAAAAQAVPGMLRSALVGLSIRRIPGQLMEGVDHD